MGLEFTRLNIFKTNHRNPLPADDQIIAFIKELDGELKKWQVVSVSPEVRVLYYELEGSAKPKKVTGSELERRMELEGKTKKVK